MLAPTTTAVSRCVDILVLLVLGVVVVLTSIRDEGFGSIGEIAYSEAKPRSRWRMAYVAASARPLRPSLARMLATWCSTVFRLM